MGHVRSGRGQGVQSNFGKCCVIWNFGGELFFFSINLSNLMNMLCHRMNYGMELNAFDWKDNLNSDKVTLLIDLVYPPIKQL